MMSHPSKFDECPGQIFKFEMGSWAEMPEYYWSTLHLTGLPALVGTKVSYPGATPVLPCFVKALG